MQVTVFVHPHAAINVPQGWRWAVHLGGNPHNLDECLNAGWCPTKTEAALEGEMVGVAVAKAVDRVSSPRPVYRVSELPDDPISQGTVGDPSILTTRG